ncbi:MAG TPA: GNAT family N-acetyltransferase [Clostridiales bacterium]|nr:GNAT family N-acetyltransferase [Clostridiales bacterium]
MEEIIMCNHELNETETVTYKGKYELRGNKQLIVRIPEESDAQELIDYIKAVDCETKYLAREPGEFSFSLEQEKDFVRSFAYDKNSQMLVGQVDGTIVANCSVGIVMNNRRYIHRAALGISVMKAYWGMGIGRVLMEECIDWCKSNRVEQLELEVVTENERAIAMYKNLGFEIHGTKKHALKYSNGTYVDEYFMILPLD